MAQVTNVYNNYTVNRTENVNEYTYARNVSAVTVVDRETFVNARPVANATLRVTPEQFEKAHVVETAPLAPTRNSYVASTAKPVPASQRPAKSFTDRKVVAKLPPPIPPSGGHEPHIVDSAKPERPAEPSSRTQQSNAESNPNTRENNNCGECEEQLHSANRTHCGESSTREQNAQGEQPKQYDQHPAVKFVRPRERRTTSTMCTRR